MICDFIPAHLFSLVNWLIERTFHPLAVALVLAQSRQTLLFLRWEKPRLVCNNSNVIENIHFNGSSSHLQHRVREWHQCGLSDRSKADGYEHVTSWRMQSEYLLLFHSLPANRKEISLQYNIFIIWQHKALSLKEKHTNGFNGCTMTASATLGIDFKGWILTADRGSILKRLCSTFGICNNKNNFLLEFYYTQNQYQISLY